MTVYMLRNIPGKLWKAFKRKADSEGLAMRSLILMFIEAYVNGQIAIKASGAADHRAVWLDHLDARPAPVPKGPKVIDPTCPFCGRENAPGQKRCNSCNEPLRLVAQ